MTSQTLLRTRPTLLHKGKLKQPRTTPEAPPMTPSSQTILRSRRTLLHDHHKGKLKQPRTTPEDEEKTSETTMIGSN